MSSHRKYSAVPSAPSNTSKTQAVADQWPASDITIAVFHLKAIGASEDAAWMVLDHLAAHGVRRVAAYVRNWTEGDLERWEAAHRHAQRPTRRGDIIHIRSTVRWPWRVST